MRHLLNSAFRVERLQLVTVNGRAVTDYAQATSTDPNENDLLQYLPGRLDLGFIRQGKDIVPAPEAGKAPDRVGLLIVDAYAPIKAGDRLIAIENMQGKIPVKGTFEIRPIPDEAQGYSDTHHIEVQVTEVNQNLNQQNWPGEEPE